MSSSCGEAVGEPAVFTLGLCDPLYSLLQFGSSTSATYVFRNKANLIKGTCVVCDKQFSASSYQKLNKS